MIEQSTSAPTEPILEHSLRRYTAAVLSVVVLTGVRFAVGHWLGDRAPFSIYVIGVAFSAWYGGFGPAILSLAAGIICGIAFFASADLFTDRSRLWAFFLVVLTGLMVAALGAARRRAERLASSRKEELDQVLRQMNDAFLVVSQQWRVLYFNDQAVRWLGRSPEELSGKTLWQVWPIRMEPALQQQLVDVMDRRQPARLETPLDQPDRWAELHASPAQQGMTLTISDISARKMSEAQIVSSLTNERSAREEAERANRMKDEFLATLSHELRTPLNAILGWSQLLNGQATVPGDWKQGIAAIERNARAQAQLIEDLLDMSRITSGRLKLDITSVSMIDVINASLEAAAPAASAKRITLDRRWPANMPHVNADAARLQQIVWNLLTNAIKFTPPDGQISVGMSSSSDSLRLTISDNGEGIDPEFMPQIFGRFQQADGSTTRRHGGLGLGLAIARQLTELHGGTIFAASEGRGKGSSFTLQLPLPRVAASLPRTYVDSGERANLAGLDILLVEDEPDTRDLVRRVLAAANATVTAVANAADAFEAIQEHRPHVLISDIAMPGEDGFGLIARIRRLPHDRGGTVPALALTALARPEDQARALSSGFQQHLPKPIDAQRLIQSIAALAAGHSITD